MIAVTWSLMQDGEVRAQQHLQRFVPVTFLAVLPLSALIHWLGRSLGHEPGKKSWDKWQVIDEVEKAAISVE